MSKVGFIKDKFFDSFLDNREDETEKTEKASDEFYKAFNEVRAILKKLDIDRDIIFHICNELESGHGSALLEFMEHSYKSGFSVGFELCQEMLSK